VIRQVSSRTGDPWIRTLAITAAVSVAVPLLLGVLLVWMLTDHFLAVVGEVSNQNAEMTGYLFSFFFCLTLLPYFAFRAIRPVPLKIFRFGLIIFSGSILAFLGFYIARSCWLEGYYFKAVAGILLSLNEVTLVIAAFKVRTFSEGEVSNSRVDSTVQVDIEKVPGTESYLERLWLVSTVVSLCIVLYALIRLAFYLGTSDQLMGGILLLVTGLMPCSVVVINWYLVQKSKSWPMVTGELIEADMKVKTRHGEGITEKLWIPQIRYRYSVFDRTYLSTRIAFGGQLKYSNWGKARTFIRKYQVGDKVPVFYHPEKPKSAVLEKRAAGEFYSMGRVVLIIFALFGLLFYPTTF